MMYPFIMSIRFFFFSFFISFNFMIKGARLHNSSMFRLCKDSNFRPQTLMIYLQFPHQKLPHLEFTIQYFSSIRKFQTHNSLLFRAFLWFFPLRLLQILFTITQPRFNTKINYEPIANYPCAVWKIPKK